MTQQYSNRKIQRNNTIEFDRQQNYHKLVFNFHLRVITVMYNLPYPRLGNFLKYIPIGQFWKKKLPTLIKKKPKNLPLTFFISLKLRYDFGSELINSFIYLSIEQYTTLHTTICFEFAHHGGRPYFPNLCLP